MKIDRLIGIIMILLQKDKVTAPELAERFEVSRRTIHRDIDDICKAGIPVITVQGSNGGISICDSYKIDKALFNYDELQAVFSGLKGIDSISENSYLTKMVEKLSSKKNPVEIDNTIIIDLASHYQKPLTQKIEFVKTAIQNRQCISFQYFYQKGEGIRKIEPYHLIFKWSSWYVFGYCLDREAYRLFKLNRLWNICFLGEGFMPRKIPEKELQFDHYFSSNSIHLKALFSSSEKYRLIEEYGIDSYQITDTGQLLLERDFVSYENMRAWIFSFGDKVSVIEPVQLFEDRKQQAENILLMKSRDDTIKQI